MNSLSTQDAGASRRPPPLSGYRVLDLSSVVMGPYATQLLADMGAEIVCVEPLTGGPNRGMGAGQHEEFSGIALNLLRNKRSLSIDIKSHEGREIILRLMRDCDVVVTNLRPLSLARLKLAYADICAENPRLIYCQAQGFRSDSARADDPAYDDIIQAETGVADAYRRSGRDPGIAPTILADKVCGMAIVQAVLAGLLDRERSGRGQRIEVPMFDVMQAFMLVEHGAGAIAKDGEAAGYGRVLTPERGPQKTIDGWINVLPYSTAAYDALFREGGREDLVGDLRTINRREIQVNVPFLYAQLRPIIATRTTSYWLDFCDRHRIPVGRIADLDEMVSALPLEQHPQAGPYRHIPFPIWFEDSAATYRSPAPLVGQDSEAILQEAGYSAAEIEGFAQSQVVRIRA